ncbi:MAG: CehA/McbA family metallohydrolase [Acidobacteriaceae bacterium]|nr:CehA/McbA family metallohydrolase [Acidobacteriaceae bacterium]
MLPFSRRDFLEVISAGTSFVIANERARAQAAPPSSERQWTPNWISGQPVHHPSPNASVALQPLADQVRLIESVFDYLGQPFASTDRERINTALASTDENGAIAELQRILDRYALVTITINPEGRVGVARGAAVPEIIQDGTRLFLVKVLNQAGSTATLQVQSPNSKAVYVSAWKDESPEPKERITPEEIRDRWADISLYQKQPLSNRLSGLALEYAILEIYSRDSGQRSAQINFNIGQGSEDLGFQNDVEILFTAIPAHSIVLRVEDDGGGPTMASFIFRNSLGAIYPSQSKRLAPDFFFQPQVYRADGETIRLAEGSYEVTCTGGTDYISEVRQLRVHGESSEQASFQLKRWINPAKYGWYAGDHHIHAAGCSHYVTPSEGVDPAVMMRQVEGEHLNVGCVLNWAPCYYHQKQFFTGHDNPLSKPNTILHYDLEISGFPSSHCGHLVLLGLQDQNFPGAKRIEEWPTWNLPILQWAKSQGAVVGYPHSGWGLEVKSTELPNYEIPPFDGIGANEYIVDVTHPNAVDFISAGDTPYIWELNIWYHTLNAGFRTRLSGETDFPCITDKRVGQGRVYARVEGRLTYRSWLDALQRGDSYMSDGKSHLMDFAVNGKQVGSNGSQLHLTGPGTVQVAVQAAAYLDALPRTNIRERFYDNEPYWDIERARIGSTRAVQVEAVFNGRPVASKSLLADGGLQTLDFSLRIEESGWLALRILPSCHTNPIFVTVGREQMRPLRKTVEWCLAAVDQCWSQKAAQISANEFSAAKKAYDHARQVYTALETGARA